jgi:hypothetical protein
MSAQSYQDIMQRAQRLHSDPSLRAAHFKRTKPCGILKCPDHEKCQFAHNEEEYRLPECFYSHFCKNVNCTMYHTGRMTKEEYMKKNNVTFRKNLKIDDEKDEKIREKHEPPGAFTKMCNVMTSSKPCPRKVCFFAHSIQALRVPTCYERGCRCEKFHNYCKCCPHDCRMPQPTYCKEKLSYTLSMGHHIEPFMLGDDSSNILSMLDEKFKQLDLIDDLRKEEEMGTESFEKMKEYEKDIEEINQFIENQHAEEEEFAEQELAFLLEQERLIEDDDYLP